MPKFTKDRTIKARLSAAIILGHVTVREPVRRLKNKRERKSEHKSVRKSESK